MSFADSQRTETAPTISVTDIDRPRDDDTVGEIVPDVSVRIVDDAGAAVPDGQYSYRVSATDIGGNTTMAELAASGRSRSRDRLS